MREAQQMRAQGSNSSNSNTAMSQQQQRQQDIICEHRFVESVLDLHDRFKSITLDCFRAQPRVSQDAFGPSTRPTPQADSLFQKALKEGPYGVTTSQSCQKGIAAFSAQGKMPHHHAHLPCMHSPGGYIAFSLTVSAFESFVNAQSLQPPFAQLLASFCDRILRKAGGTASCILRMWHVIGEQSRRLKVIQGTNCFSRLLLSLSPARLRPLSFGKHHIYRSMGCSFHCCSASSMDCALLCFKTLLSFCQASEWVTRKLKNVL